MADQKGDAANAQFKKLQRAADGKKAMSEYETEAAAVAAKTARLRALRLAKEAEAIGVIIRTTKLVPGHAYACASRATDSQNNGCGKHHGTPAASATAAASSSTLAAA